jgi:peptide-methionine (S)-S-oxide reductase
MTDWTTTMAPFRHRIPTVALLVGGLVVAGVALRPAAQGEKARIIPVPATDENAGQARSAVAVLAGGCFWGVQGVFQHVAGVTSAISGYAGGQKETARYEMVGTGRTGHAEAVQVTYDPRQITYGRLLQIFFSVVHDPTQLNRQGPDTGTEYRSTIFPASAEQARVAKAYIAQLEQARVFPAAIVTTLEMDRPFFPAEDYHQDFLTRHPTHPYIMINDLPKVKELKRVFPDVYRATPVLVGGTR